MITSPSWNKHSNEKVQDYSNRLLRNGETHIQVIKNVREQYLLDLVSAREIVITKDEIDIFLEANAKRKLTRKGVFKITGYVFGGLQTEINSWIDDSGYWPE